MGPGNPFQVFFPIWLVICTGLLTLGSFFYPTSVEYDLMVLAYCIVYFAVAVCMWVTPDSMRMRGIRTMHVMEYRKKPLMLAQIACVLIIPLVYKQANSLADGNIFSVTGYVALRRAMTEDMTGYGALSYFLPISYVLTAINTSRFLSGQIGFLHFAVSVGVSCSFAYLSTGRTFFLMLACMVMFPLIVTKQIRLKGFIIFSIIVACAFALVATMTAKGVSAEASSSDNLTSALRELRIYIFSPAVAMSYLIETLRQHTFGDYTFRFIFAAMNKVGFDLKVHPLIRDFVSIPEPTNVFTVMDPYYRDFSGYGVMVFAVVSSVLHAYLYIKMRKKSGAYVYIYSAFMFALVMQFFQDMYMSLLSTWLQITFWYWFFVKRGFVAYYVPNTRRRKRFVFRRRTIVAHR
nr:O-antigen polymerase [Cupriavidus malaysiensis]